MKLLIPGRKSEVGSRDYSGAQACCLNCQSLLEFREEELPRARAEGEALALVLHCPICAMRVYLVAFRRVGPLPAGDLIPAPPSPIHRKRIE